MLITLPDIFYIICNLSLVLYYGFYSCTIPLSSITIYDDFFLLD